ncbi:MAG: glucose 1-dehydrogenase [Kiloniellales bacterium]|nr:glucose 1-dehydrogenase [Kiloniellales bacterium]
MSLGDLFDLTDRVAVVTGASSGLGRHFAATLARAGAKVAIAARRVERLSELAREIEAAGGRALPVGLDVTDPDSVRDCVAAAENELGPISVLVNNAGVGFPEAALDLGEAEWERVIATNLTGAWRMARETARHMVRLGHGGSLVNVASVLGLGGGAQGVAYCASKAAVVNMTRALAIDLARHRIRVNALAPGYFDSEITHELLTGPQADKLRRMIPQRRFGEPADLDGPLLLLASDASRHMTGSVVVVDGGITAKAG